MTDARWAYVVDIFEKSVGSDYPVVEHAFFGRTKDEALGYFRAHLTTDDFLRSCVERNVWDGVECWSETRWEKL